MAAGSVSVDTMLADAISKLDAMSKRMDALETGEGHKNPIKGDGAKKSDDDDDDKKDDAFPPKKGKDDSTKAKSDDDDDDDKKDDATAVKTKILDDDDDDDDDKKSDAATVKFGDDGELEIKHEPGEEKKKGDKRKDSAKKSDAFPPKKAKDDSKAKSDDDDDDAKDDDDDDDDKKDDAAKADSVAALRRQVADQSAMLRRLESLMKPKSDDEHAAFADAQSRADAVFNGFGQRAPRPLEGEDLIDYRKRLASKLKGYSPQWKNTKFRRLDDETFTTIEAQVYADATQAASTPADLNPGELREVQKIDPRTGQKTIVFYGKESFVKQMGRPGRRVQSFRTLGSI